MSWRYEVKGLDMEEIMNLVSCLGGTKNRTNGISIDDIKKVIINYPATIIIWKDGTKTIVKCAEDDEYNVTEGIARAIMKKMFNNSGHALNKWVDKVIMDNVRNRK